MNYTTHTVLVEKIKTTSEKIIFRVVKDFKDSYSYDELTILKGDSSLSCTVDTDDLDTGNKWLFNLIDLKGDNKEFHLSICFESALDVSHDSIIGAINSNDSSDTKHWSKHQIEKELGIDLNSDSNIYYIIILLLIIGLIIKKTVGNTV